MTFTDSSVAPPYVGEVSSIFTFSSRFAKKSQSPKTPPKKLESSPTTHVTETSFLHVLDPPDHFGTIYIFDHFFTFGLSFFSTNFPQKSQSPELAAYSHSAADSPKKVRVQKHPQKSQSPAPQPTSQKPVFSTFQTLLIILVPSTFSIIFSPLDLDFFNKFPEKSQSPELAAYSHSAADSPKKSQSPKTPPKKLESSPTTHVTETSFLHVLDPPDHFGTIYIFDHFFTFGLRFF